MTARESLTEYLDSLKKSECQDLARALIGHVPGRSKQHAIGAILRSVSPPRESASIADAATTLGVFLKGQPLPQHRFLYLIEIVTAIATGDAQ